ncbi:hypothetical protein OY10_004570 [Salmonella enterica subsp. enterica serovar Havana]|nr:hypothetical protein [Salmonella enterica subsp. enterica serovar Havana]EDV6712209.1 hypothetical protein [Salmonella enterica subsp. enterica serovar Havana]
MKFTDEVWKVLNRNFKHKHLWFTERQWSWYDSQAPKAKQMSGQPTIVTGSGRPVAKWHPWNEMWYLVTVPGKGIMHEAADDIYSTPPTGQYIDPNDLKSYWQWRSH